MDRISDALCECRFSSPLFGIQVHYDAVCPCLVTSFKSPVCSFVINNQIFVMVNNKFLLLAVLEISQHQLISGTPFIIFMSGLKEKPGDTTKMPTSRWLKGDWLHLLYTVYGANSLNDFQDCYLNHNWGVLLLLFTAGFSPLLEYTFAQWMHTNQYFSTYPYLEFTFNHKS